MPRPFLLGLEVGITGAAELETEGLFGRVGYNTGNLAFHYAINAHLGGDLCTLGWHAPVVQLNSAGGTVVFAAANQLGEHIDLRGMAQKFAKLSVPVVVIGLGAQGGLGGVIPSVPQGTLDWVRASGDRAPGSSPNIALRGEFTRKVLESYGLAGRTVVTGCPTLFMSPDPNLGRAIAAKVGVPKRVSVCAGHQGWHDLSRIESALAQVVTQTGGSYVAQSPIEMIRLARGEGHRIDAEELAACRDYVAPSLTTDAFLQWMGRYGRAFFDIPSWMSHLGEFDFVVGTRIHGVMLALQAGTPALCIAHDSRTLELCQIMMIPHVVAHEFPPTVTPEVLRDLFVFDAARFDENRRRLCRLYVDFLEGNSLCPSDWLVELAVPRPK